MGARAVRWLASVCRTAVAQAVERRWLRGVRLDHVSKRARITRSQIARGVSVGGAIAAVFGVAYADTVVDTVMDRARPEYDPKGIPLGGFRLFPALDLRASTSNNVFQTDTGRRGDVSFTIAPSFTLTSDWSRHHFEAFGDLVALRHGDFTSEDVTDWSLGATGRVDIQRGSSVTALASTGRQHEGRSSPNSPGNLAEPIRYALHSAHLSVTTQPNRFRGTLGLEFDRYSYEDTPLNGGGFLDNTDRDRDELRLFARASFELSEGYRAFVEAAHESRGFDRAIDRTGINRDSDGTNFNAGIEFELVGLLQGEALVGYLDRRFGAPLQDFSGLNYGVKLNWSVTPITTVHLRAERVLEETIVAGSSIIADKRFGIGVDHELQRNVIIQADIAHAESDFVGSARNDTQFDARIGATYLIDNNLRATAGYERRDRDSNVPGEDFSEDKFHVSLRLQL